MNGLSHLSRTFTLLVPWLDMLSDRSAALWWVPKFLLVKWLDACNKIYKQKGVNVALRRKSGPGVIVLGSDFKALGVVRSLGRRGIPSVIIDTLPRSAWFSRYVTKR